MDRPHSRPPTDHGTESDSTATNSSDEFDWDDADQEEIMKANDPKKAKRIRRLYLLFMKLSPWVRILFFGILGSAVCITPFLVFILRFPQSIVYKQVTAWSVWLSITWAAGALTALIVNLLPRFIIWVFYAIWGKAPEQVKTYIELFMAVSGWLKLALDISWLWITLSVIRSQVQPPGHYWTYVNRAVSALFSAGVIFLVEKLVLQFIAIRFHQKALADRLIENHLGLRALDKLSVAPAMTARQAAKKRREHQKRHLQSSRASSMDMLANVAGTGQAMHPEPAAMSPISPGRSRANSPNRGFDEKDESRQTPSPRPREGRRKKTKITTQIMAQLGDAIGQVALKDSKFNRAGEIGSLHSARQLARQLFANLSSVTPPRSHLIVEDFYPYFRDKEDAATAFHLFDKDDNGDISKKEMREAVQRIYRERKALTASLKDMSSAVAKLDGVLIAVAFMGILFVCLLIFNRSNTVESLVPLATIVLGFSFIFGHSAQTLFESLIFIFSTHPFDVGDLVIIDDQPLFVKEFGLFSTVFTRVDGQEIIAPNALLASSKLLHNVRRSGSMWETTNLMVAYDTPVQKIELLKTKLRAYMAENSREWGSPGCEVNIDKMDFQNDIHLIVAIEHRANWQNWGNRWTRRNSFMRHMKNVLEEIGIGYRMPLQPVSFHPSSITPQNMGININDMLGNAGQVGGERARGQVPPPVTAQAGRY